MLPHADEALPRKLVLRGPQKAHRLAPPDELSARRCGSTSPAGAADLLPERRQDDVGLREEQRQADAVDPCLPRRVCGSRRLVCRSASHPPVYRASIRPGGRRRARRARRAALRRHLGRAASRVLRAQPVQRRPPDASGLTGGRGARSRGVAGRRRPPRKSRRATGGWRRTTPARTAWRARVKGSVPRCRSRRTRMARCFRTSARTPARRKDGCACSVRRTRNSSRSSCSTTPTRSSSVPTASRRWTSTRAACAPASGRSRATSSSSARRS